MTTLPHEVRQARRVAAVSEVFDSGVLRSLEVGAAWQRAAALHSRGDISFLAALERVCVELANDHDITYCPPAENLERI